MDPPGVSAYQKKAKEEEDANNNSLTLDDSREYEEDDPRLQQDLEEPRVTPRTTKTRSRRLPTFLSIPKCMPAAACFYLTDGEGLSDSELLDEEEDEREEAPYDEQRA